MEKKGPDFEKMKTDDAIRLLGADAQAGLGEDEVVRRLGAQGYNEVPEKKDNPAARFLGKFWGLGAWLLEAIIILSYVTGRYSDLAIVAALLLLNAVIGFLQEQNAARAVEALKRKLQVSARVLRAGAWKTVPARELVGGDIVRLRIGDFVPADVKILSGEVAADQSSLTGESGAVSKKAGNLLFSGSILAQGECTGLAVRTGANTYFGRTVQLVQIAAPKLHIEEVIAKVVQALLGVTLAVLIVIFAISVAQGHDLLALLPLMLILLLGAVPVALPAMFTVSMALGARELVEKGVLITRLSAPDDAASMDILCVDKTGTLTQNKVTVARLMPWKGWTEADVALCGALSSNEANHDAIDMAFIEKAKAGRLLSSAYQQERFVPFDPKTRRTEAIIRHGGRRFKVMKGSVQAIAKLCALSGADRARLDEYAADCARSGYRALAVCRADGGRMPRLVGVAALQDPPRPDSKDIIERLRQLGVAVKMLTGDAMPVARQIGARVGIGAKAVTGAQLREAGEKDAKAGGGRGRVSSAQAAIAESSDIFAEIYPEDKYSIVRDFQAR
ncbi:MAG: HAD-IC family P-type ATPase, partial [Candidatus Micrarchaeota archaeon]|nr:HAD-IC family P-type ATPase [Candidatus Micrarchaeota archaeon]